MKKIKILISFVFSLGIICLGFSFAFNFDTKITASALSQTEIVENIMNGECVEKGGAIYLSAGSTYNMSGGEISGHFAEKGGALYISDSAVFTMTGGTITGNYAKYGGAIYVASGGECYINGGTITGNFAENAPAIYVESGGILEISDNALVDGNEYVKMSPTNINIYVDGTLSKTIAKLGDSYTIDESEMPLDYEHCCGYFLDEELTKTIKNDTIDLTSAGQEITFAPRTATASSEGVNIYTRTADPSLFTFTTDGADGYIITKNSAVTYSGTEFNLVMPREYEDKTVTRIADSAFLSCSGLTSVIIPDGVTSIGELAFNGCSGLTSVIIPNSVTSLEALVFWGCSGLTSAYIPSSVTSIGSGLFIKCSSSLVIYTDVVDASSVSSGWEEFWNYYSGSEALTVNYGYTLEQYKSAVGLTFAPNGEKVSGAEVETAEEDKAYQVDNSYLQDVIFEIKYFILPKKIEIA